MMPVQTLLSWPLVPGPGGGRQSAGQPGAGLWLRSRTPVFARSPSFLLDISHGPLLLNAIQTMGGKGVSAPRWVLLKLSPSGTVPWAQTV